jgi:4'-phosphopantetheinyl transferase
MGDPVQPPHDIVVRATRTNQLEDATHASSARHLLSLEERRSLARLRSAAERRDRLAAHVLARTMLAEALATEPDRIRIRAAPWTAPVVVAPAHAPTVRFSISHADGTAICAIACGRDIGIDVESFGNVGPRPLDVAGTVCSAEERADLLAASPADRPVRLLTIWTLKEAIAKATGLGFRLPMASITVRPGINRSLSVVFGRDCGVDPANWRFFSIRLSPHHLAAIATRGDQGDVNVRFEETTFLGPAQRVTETRPSPPASRTRASAPATGMLRRMWSVGRGTWPILLALIALVRPVRAHAGTFETGIEGVGGQTYSYATLLGPIRSWNTHALVLGLDVNRLDEQVSDGVTSGHVASPGVALSMGYRFEGERAGATVRSGFETRWTSSAPAGHHSAEGALMAEMDAWKQTGERVTLEATSGYSGTLGLGWARADATRRIGRSEALRVAAGPELAAETDPAQRVAIAGGMAALEAPGIGCRLELRAGVSWARDADGSFERGPFAGTGLTLDF